MDRGPRGRLPGADRGLARGIGQSLQQPSRRFSVYFRALPASDLTMETKHRVDLGPAAPSKKKPMTSSAGVPREPDLGAPTSWLASLERPAEWRSHRVRASMKQGPALGHGRPRDHTLIAQNRGPAGRSPHGPASVVRARQPIRLAVLGGERRRRAHRRPGRADRVHRGRMRTLGAAGRPNGACRTSPKARLARRPAPSGPGRLPSADAQTRCCSSPGVVKDSRSTVRS